MGGFVNTIDLLGEEATIDSLIDGSITEFNDNQLTRVGIAAFCATHVVSVKLPAVTEVATIGFIRCLSLKKADFSSQVTFYTYAFYTCNQLKTLILRSETLCRYSGAIAAPLLKEGKGGYIYVPKALIEAYKSADTWKDGFAFRALEDYTIDGTITGELDESKI